MRLTRFLNEKYFSKMDYEKISPSRLVSFSKKQFDKFASVVKLLEKRCKPFLNEMEDAEGFIYRGSKNRKDVYVQEVVPRTDRRPKDMPQWLHDMFDHEFKKKFGWSPRSEGVFTTAKKSDARSYGTTYSFWPVGKYEYLYAPGISDLYYWIDGEHLSDPDDSGDDWDYYNERYEEEYGQDANGHWEFDGEDVGDSWGIAVDNIKDSDDYQEGDEDDLEWVPDKSFDEYMENIRDSGRENVDDKISDALSQYKDRDLALAVREEVEIMFRCDSYLLIDSAYDSLLYKLIQNKHVQLELPGFGEINLELKF
jgi:hypothetical protein